MMLRIGMAPIGKGRPRASGKGGFVRMYTPKKTRAWEEEFAEKAAALTDRRGMTGPLAVSVVAVFPRVKRLPKCGARVPHTVKPDVDNIAKAVLDGLEKSGIIADDKFVCSLTAESRYAASSEDAHLEVGVWPWP